MRHSAVKLHLIITCLLLGLLAATLSIAWAQENTYTIPAPPEGVDLNQVIGRVGDVEITLGDFAARLRYEHVRFYYILNDLVNREGAGVLALDDPNNAYAADIQRIIYGITGASFAEQVYAAMILEQLYTQEALTRTLTVTECDLNTNWAQMLNLAEPVNCEMPAGLDEAKAAFIQQEILYSGITPAAIDHIIFNYQASALVAEAIGNEIEIPDLAAVRTRQIRVADEATAQQVLERLQNGDEFQALLLEYSQDSGIRGNSGELGTLARGQMVAEFEEVAFSAEVGAFVGPVQTQFGYHIIQVTAKQYPVQVRHILLNTEAEAYLVLNQLENGADFAELASSYSVDALSAYRDGDLGLITAGQTGFGAEFEAAAFAAEANQIVGPIQSSRGYHILEVTDRGTEPSAVSARHILLATEAEALEVKAQLETGADFATLAVELSIDPSAAGNRGDTLAIFTQGREQGLYSTESVTAEYDVAFDAAVGDRLGPIASRNGYLIVEVLELGTVPPSEELIQREQSAQVTEWENAQLASDRVEQTRLWIQFLPQDPLPSAAFPVLLPLDAFTIEAVAANAEMRAQTTLPNILRELQLPDDLLPQATDGG